MISKSRENVFMLRFLLQMFQSESLGKNASRDVVKDIVHNLLTIMLDSRLQELEDGPQVVRSVNIMIVKIVEKSDPTNSMRLFFFELFT